MTFRRSSAAGLGRIAPPAIRARDQLLSLGARRRHGDRSIETPDALSFPERRRSFGFRSGKTLAELEKREFAHGSARHHGRQDASPRERPRHWPAPAQRRE